MTPNIPTKIIKKSESVAIELDEIIQGAIDMKKRRIILKVPKWDLQRAMKQYRNKNPKIIKQY